MMFNAWAQMASFEDQQKIAARREKDWVLQLYSYGRPKRNKVHIGQSVLEQPAAVCRDENSVSMEIRFHQIK